MRKKRQSTYWIAKRGFHGIRPFKRAVLTGQFRGHLTIKEASVRPGRLPVADRVTLNGDPVFTGETLPVTLDRGRGLYVLRYAGPCEPGTLPGDYLIIGPLDLGAADWVLAVGANGKPALRRVVRLGEQPALLDCGQGMLDATARPVGTVLQVCRLLPPATL